MQCQGVPVTPENIKQRHQPTRAERKPRSHTFAAQGCKWQASLARTSDQPPRLLGEGSYRSSVMPVFVKSVCTAVSTPAFRMLRSQALIAMPWENTITVCLHAEIV